MSDSDATRLFIYISRTCDNSDVDPYVAVPFSYQYTYTLSLFNRSSLQIPLHRDGNDISCQSYIACPAGTRRVSSFF